MPSISTWASSGFCREQNIRFPTFMARVRNKAGDGCPEWYPEWQKLSAIATVVHSCTSPGAQFSMKNQEGQGGFRVKPGMTEDSDSGSSPE